MKFKLIAAAALLAATGAQAAIDSGNPESLGTDGGRSLLASVSFGTNASGRSATFDLGLTFNQVAAWQASIITTLSSGGTEWFRSWNLNTGAVEGTDLAPSIIGNYSTVYADFTAAATTAGATNTAQLNVFTNDPTGTEPGQRTLITTGNFVAGSGAAALPTLAQTPNNGVFLQAVNNGLQNNWLAANNNNGTHATDANGASLVSNGSLAYFNNSGTMERLGTTNFFDANGQYNGTYTSTTTTFGGQTKVIPFFTVSESSNDPFAKATVSALGYDIDGDGNLEFDNNGTVAGGLNEVGLWSLQNGVLSFSVTAVPEPETYAMLLAGLGLMGAIARRRRNAA